MYRRFFQEKKIKDRLSKISEVNPQLCNLVLEKIEFNKYFRIKKTIRQLLIKFLSMGIKYSLKDLSCKSIVKRINDSMTNKKKILFVAGLPTFHLIGICIYLRKRGDYEFYLVMENPWLKALFEKYFDFVYVYNSNYDVARILVDSEPYFIHVHGSPQYYFLGVMAIFLSNCRKIIGFCDVPSLSEDIECYASQESLMKYYEKVIATSLDRSSEDVIFKKADGIILAINTFSAGERLLQKHKSNTPLIEFPAYLCDEFIGREEKYSKKDGKIHILYGGTVAPITDSSESFSMIQFIELANKLNKQGIYFHIYTSPYESPFQFKKRYSNYIKLASKVPNFSIRKGVPNDKASIEFSKYDYAIITSLNYALKIETCHKSTVLSSKFFTYLSAGLPMIASKDDGYIAYLIKKHEIGIVIEHNEIEYLSEIIKKCDYEKLLNNVRRVREEFSMGKHIDRLIEFYEKSITHAS